MLGTNETFISILKYLTWCFAHFLAVFGFAMIMLEALGLSPAASPLLDLFGAVSAPLGLFLVSVSIYFERLPRTPPSDVSKKFLAPLMMILSALFLGMAIWRVGLGARYVDGLTVIALGGALLRLTGNPLLYGGRRADGSN